MHGHNEPPIGCYVAKQFGATKCLNPTDSDKVIQGRWFW